jgi:hypothetical protein
MDNLPHDPFGLAQAVTLAATASQVRRPLRLATMEGAVAALADLADDLAARRAPRDPDAAAVLGGHLLAWLATTEPRPDLAKALGVRPEPRSKRTPQRVYRELQAARARGTDV